MTATNPYRRPLSRRTPQPRSVVGGTLIGVFIGIVVGLGLAATVAYWLMKNNPALPLPSLRGNADVAKDTPQKVAKAETAKNRFDFYKILPGGEEPTVQADRRPPDRGDRAVADQSKDRPSDKAAKAAPAEPAKAVDKPALSAEPAGKPAAPAEPVKSAKLNERLWLQAGSFSAERDADAVRARLAMAGWEATVQPGALPDKSVRYRVRLGPYDNSDELARMKNELAKRGFDVAVFPY